MDYCLSDKRDREQLLYMVGRQESGEWPMAKGQGYAQRLGHLISKQRYQI
jgi:hypothetical protein